jgi:hypothetical protein
MVRSMRTVKGQDQTNNEGHETRKVHTLRGSSNNTGGGGKTAVRTFHPKHTLYHYFYLAETTPNKPGFPYSLCPLLSTP